MTRKQLVLIVVALFLAQTAWVLTQTAKPPGPLKTERVKGDLYMISGEGGNVALYATSEGVVLVDDMFPTILLADDHAVVAEGLASL